MTHEVGSRLGTWVDLETSVSISSTGRDKGERSETPWTGQLGDGSHGSCMWGQTSQPAWVGEAGAGTERRSFLTSLLSVLGRKITCSTHPFVNPNTTLTECPLETNERVPAHHY